MREIGLVTGSRDTAESLLRQLDFFLAEKVKINTYIIDEGFIEFGYETLLVFSSKSLFEEAKTILNIPDVDIIIGVRTINYDCLEEVVSIPSGKSALLVNDVEDSVREVEDALKELGLDHIKITGYYPGKLIEDKLFDYVITPGELSIVPIGMTNVVDIGSRIFDFKTIARILSALNMFDESSIPFSKMYLEKIINVTKKLASSREDVIRLNTNLNQVIDSFNAGLLVFDKDFKILASNDTLKHILRVNRYSINGKELKIVVHNKNLLKYLKDDNNESAFELNMDGIEYVVTKFRVTEGGFTCVTIKSGKSIRSESFEALNKGHIAKYRLNDIVGHSDAVIKLKSIIPKLSRTDMNILIQGESGTGKELLASSIHNESERAMKPFLAVNFSALPDELIESELFGYVEGAFTGAKRGGKTGLFEDADGGTIFLDEIGDVSMKVQSRLLRVLEEREIMPIGSNEIKPIDVRVIAATNKDLKKMVEEKTFREDLYYRLKMGSIYIQPLRNRRDDIPELVSHMVGLLSSTNIRVDDELINKLCKYDWPGNIRELKNTITFMLAVRSSDRLILSDLPDEFFLEQNYRSKTIGEDKKDRLSLETLNEIIEDKQLISDEQYFFLSLIKEMTNNNQSVSRITLSEKSKSGIYNRTENQVRRILKELERLNVINLSRGRRGIALTQKGIELLR